MPPTRRSLRVGARRATVGVLKRLWMASLFARPPIQDRIDKAIWYSRMARWRRSHECPVSGLGSGVYAEVARSEELTGPIVYLEFGMYEGESMRWWLSENRHPDSRFVGFDSFEGLPEAWRTYQKGHFATAVPDLDDPRCRVVAGLFQRTLPRFLEGYTPTSRQVVFLDADLYSSTDFVLQHIGPYLRPGDLLLFDELHDCMHEFRAFVAFLSAFPIEYQVLHRSPDWSRVAMKVLSNPHAIVS